MRSLLTTGAAALVVTAGLAASAAAASAATLPSNHVLPRVAAGSVELGNPLQYETFLALQSVGHHHGGVDYTNWTYAEPGSGVWAPAGRHRRHRRPARSPW